jgi:DNA-binding NtrC family response regulator/HAMP domain-containing protein
MKKKIYIALVLYTLVFLLGGVYITLNINSSMSTMNNLISLYQIEGQRKSLLIRVKGVQSDLLLQKTPFAKGFETVIADVKTMERMTNKCFSCHHSDYIMKRLNNLKANMEDYKHLVSRVLTFRANKERLWDEEKKAFTVAESLLEEIDNMVHSATLRLTKQTRYSFKDISHSNIILFGLIGITPFLAAGLGFIFLRGFTNPVKTLLNATQKLKNGKFDYRIDGLKDEFGVVASSFNQMASQVEDYTRKLERKSMELELAHQEMSTFCQVLRKIGVQRTLDGVGAFLITELREILKTPYLRLYIFSSDHSCIFAISEKGTDIIEEPEQLKTISDILDGVEGPTIAPKVPFKSPLIPDDFPADGRQAVIPFRIGTYTYGAFVVVSNQDCLCGEKELNLAALILEQASGTIKRVVLHQEEVRAHREQTEKKSEFSGIIGKSSRMQIVYKLIDDIAGTDAMVLIQGETGTGKELVARAIHRKSLRKEKPFIVVDCAAYPSTLLESELFGHEKGAFTGAVRQKTGRFEQADRGTVFLDEIGEVPLSAQIKLLRVLQTQKFERIGGEQTVAVDVRIIAATNRDLLQDVKEGKFREDLYYRLNVIPIHVPSLKMRGNDIPLLSKYFLHKFANEHNAAAQDFSSEVMRILMDYPWPGNVRELENTIEHAAVLSKGKYIEVSHLPSNLENYHPISPVPSSESQGSIMDHEKKLLQDVLEECNWNKSKAAVQLGISRSTLYGKLKKYQISIPKTSKA